MWRRFTAAYVRRFEARRRSHFLFWLLPAGVALLVAWIVLMGVSAHNMTGCSSAFSPEELKACRAYRTTGSNILVAWLVMGGAWLGFLATLDWVLWLCRALWAASPSKAWYIIADVLTATTCGIAVGAQAYWAWSWLTTFGGSY